MELNSTSHGSKVKSVSPAEKSLTVLKLIGPSKAFETNLKFGVFPEAETGSSSLGKLPSRRYLRRERGILMGCLSSFKWIGLECTVRVSSDISWYVKRQRRSVSPDNRLRVSVESVDVTIVAG